MYIEDFGYLNFSQYSNNQSTAVGLFPNNEFDEYATIISINIDESDFLNDEKLFFVDVNNVPKAESILTENNIAYPTGQRAKSGFVIYPLYELTDEAYKEYNKQIKDLFN